MNNSSGTLTINQPCDAAVNQVLNQLRQAGLSAIRTFDLQTARQAQMSCPCPYHGTESCDCQMVVLLVYMGEHKPVTLVAHGYEGQTEFSVVDTPQQRVDAAVDLAIRACFAQPDVAVDA